MEMEYYIKLLYYVQYFGQWKNFMYNKMDRFSCSYHYTVYQFNEIGQIVCYYKVRLRG